MNTAPLKKFAQYARRFLIEQVSVKSKFVMASDSPARRENPQAVVDLEKQIAETSQDRMIEKVAYIWFNRFCALRFMDVNRYTSIGVVSPAEGQFQPEILAEAKMGHIDEEMVPEKTREKVFALLNGVLPSRDPQAEAYHLLVVAVCNYYNSIMPFMFEKIADYTELLIPDDLLSDNSILAYTREAMTADICRDVEVIGWLYQFYISEKKAEVFDGLKKNKKIAPENIPAATQLFTPHWIVRYLVENSLGRLWMLNHPTSRLMERMEYYIKPETPETDFLKIGKPEEIKLCDPAGGSGHMLTYAFDILYAIYEEEGYEATEIPSLILENNLYGIEIDERAGELAAFALTMKAREKYKRFLNKLVQPNICVLRNITFDNGELKSYMDKIGRDLLTINLQTLLHQFEEADNFGSLIRPAVTDVDSVIRTLEERKVTEDLFLQSTHERALLALKQADYLSPKYHVVITNPPYMGSKGMNPILSNFLQEQFPHSCDDLMTAFMERAILLLLKTGYVGMINIPSWMFNPTYEDLRRMMLKNYSLVSLVHNGRGIFGSDFGSVSFIFKNSRPSGLLGYYRRLFEKHVQVDTPETKRKLFLDKSYRAYTANQNEFLKIGGSPLAYWISDTLKNILINERKVSEFAKAGQGIKTGENERFLRLWTEVNAKEVTSNINKNRKWFPCTKGGEFRRWYGNYEYVLNWKDDGYEIKHFYNQNGKLRSRPQNTQHFFKPGTTWSTVSSGSFSMRFFPKGMCFESAGSVCSFFDENNILHGLLFFNTKVVTQLLDILSPGIGFREGAISKLPFIPKGNLSLGNSLIKISKRDWDSSERSWAFISHPILLDWVRQLAIKDTYTALRSHWHETTMEMQRLEEENNRIFIEAYGLQDELTPDVPLNEITLTCNPYYRYGNNKNEEELESLLLADTMKEFISYAVGCMLGRYSLDKPGLILANQGETVEDYLAKVPNPTFEPDSDNVIPILEEGWFADDITERFQKFLKVTFGEEHYEENLKFIEEAIGKDVRKYFLKDFYADHVKRYKKRPIYWLFSSPKGSFNALIYMHRYRPDTVSIILSDYLREFRTKLSARKDHLDQISISASASQREKTQALKEIEKLHKIIDELDEYERDILYPLATKQTAIDLDDGVKVNYQKFGTAAKKIAGLESSEE
jgi:hypothetical protein